MEDFMSSERIDVGCDYEAQCDEPVVARWRWHRETLQGHVCTRDLYVCEKHDQVIKESEVKDETD
jgi:hypothetical protein